MIKDSPIIPEFKSSSSSVLRENRGRKTNQRFLENFAGNFIFQSSWLDFAKLFANYIRLIFPEGYLMTKVKGTVK
jgi:hypothetical protein